jgi:acetylornithine/N-succinyldiaminopimelate aminotransferase
VTTAGTFARAPLLETYARTDVTLVSGDGSWVVDAEGRRYLDLVGGIAVVGLGHRHPAPLVAAREQLDRLWHVSNLYWTEPMSRLAELLSDRFGGAQSFFCNSGAEAVESALKYARKATGRQRIVALENSFHGRTFGALSVTGQPAKRAAFEPLVPEVTFARLNDSASLAAAVDDETACILRARSSWHAPARSPTTTARCSSSTRCKPAWGGPASSSPGSARVSHRMQ